MAKTFHDLLARIEKKGALLRVSKEASAHLEIPAIAERMMKEDGGGRALLFTNVAGCDIPLAVNVFGSYTRMAMALHEETLAGVTKRVEDLLSVARIKQGMGNMLSLLSGAKELMTLPPKVVTKAYSQARVYKGDDAMLSRLPILTTWEGDGGPYFTLPMVVTKSPKDGTYNMGMYRMQVFDEKTTGMHWHRHKVGAAHFREYQEMGIKKMPVCVALGGDGALVYASTAPLPPIVDEYAFAGFLMRENVRLVKAVTNDLLVPADAEIIIEGYVDTEASFRREGPFGDHTGFYSLPDDYPEFHVEAITTSADPVYPATVVGPPPMEDYYFGYATERIFLPVLRMVLPEVVDYSMPSWGVFHNCVFVAIKKAYPGHAHKVMHALWGLGMMMLTKTIVVFDETVNVQHDREALWVALNNIDPKRDIVFAEGPLDELDHAAPVATLGSKMGVDATTKTPSEGNVRPYPDRLTRSEEWTRCIKEKWADLFSKHI